MNEQRSLNNTQTYVKKKKEDRFFNKIIPPISGIKCDKNLFYGILFYHLAFYAFKCNEHV